MLENLVGCNTSVRSFLACLELPAATFNSGGMHCKDESAGRDLRIQLVARQLDILAVAGTIIDQLNIGITQSTRRC